MKENRSKGQTGIETLVMYGIVVLVAGGAVVYLVNMGTFNPTPPTKQSYGFSQVMVYDWAVYRSTDNILVSVRNDGYEDFNVTGASASIGGAIYCSASTSQVLKPSESFVMELKCPSGAIADRYLVGSQYSTDMTVSYMRIGDQKPKESKGKFIGPIEEGGIPPSTTAAAATSTTAAATSTTAAATTSTTSGATTTTAAGATTTTTSSSTTTEATTSSTVAGATTTTTLYEGPGVEMLEPLPDTEI